MGLFGAKNRRAREIAHEILKPIGLETKDLKEHSRVDFEKEMRRVVNNDQDNALYDRQTGWRRDEQVDHSLRRTRR